TAVQTLAALLERVPFLMADQHDPVVAQTSKARPQGAIIADRAVAVQLHELVENEVDVVNRLGSIATAGDEDGFPRRQVAVLFLGKTDELAAHTANLFARAAVGLELGEQVFHFVDFFFKRQPLGRHRTILISEGVRIGIRPASSQSWLLVWPAR